MTSTGARAAIGLTTAVLAVGLAQCDRPQAPVIEAPPAVRPAGPEPDVSPNPVLERPDILALIAAAASDAAGGIVRPGPSGLDGRQFRLRIAFGCAGEDPPPPGLEPPRDGVARWVRQASDETLRLSLSSADWRETNPVGAASDGFEAIDGVWISQPWMDSEACPASGLPVTDERAQTVPPRVGLAMLRAEGGSRLGGTGSRDFSYTVRGQGGERPPAPGRGYRLVIEGRLKAWSDGRVIRCRPVRSDAPPPCVIGTEVDSIAFDDAAGLRLSEWRAG